MRFSIFLVTSTVAIALTLIGRNVLSAASNPSIKLLKQIALRCQAAKKSAQLVLEKSSSLFMRENAQSLCDALAKEGESVEGALGQNYSFSRAELIDIESLRFNYDYNEDAPFDLSYASHQRKECEKIIALLQYAQTIHDDGINNVAARMLAIFSRYQMALDSFTQNFMDIDEYRIREVAYQVWEAEGRPEGKSERHWATAIELLHSVSAADLQLALEQRRPLTDAFSTGQNRIKKELH